MADQMNQIWNNAVGLEQSVQVPLRRGVTPSSSTDKLVSKNVNASTTTSADYVNKAREAFYFAINDYQQLLAKRKELIESISPIQQQRTAKALAIADLDTEVAIENILRTKTFQEEKLARLTDLQNQHAEHAAKYGMVLNKQAIDILKDFSNINAPTLTAIMTGYEMARASAAENDAKRLENFAKLNESYNALQAENLATRQEIERLNRQMERNTYEAQLKNLDQEIEFKKYQIENMAKDNIEVAKLLGQYTASELGAQIAAAKAGAGGDGTVNFGALEPGNAQGASQESKSVPTSAMQLRALSSANKKWTGGEIPQAANDYFDERIRHFMKDPGFGGGSEHELTYEQALQNKGILEAALSDTVAKFGKADKDGNTWKYIDSESSDKKGDKGTKEDKKDSNLSEAEEWQAIRSKAGFSVASPDVPLDTPTDLPKDYKIPFATNIGVNVSKHLGGRVTDFINLYEEVEKTEPDKPIIDKFYNGTHEEQLKMFNDLIIKKNETAFNESPEEIEMFVTNTALV